LSKNVGLFWATYDVHQQQFKFEMKNGKVLTSYKNWSTSKDWILLKPKDNLDPEYTIVQSIPNGSPTLIKPSFDPLILTKITHDLVKFNAKFDDRTINWWTTLIKNLECGTDLPIPWCLDGLLNVNLRPPLPTSDPSADKNADMEMKATEAIEKMLEKETSNTEVI
jgi:hypothetical protein